MDYGLLLKCTGVVGRDWFEYLPTNDDELIHCNISALTCRFVMPFAGVSLLANGMLCPSSRSVLDAGVASAYHLLVVEGYSRNKQIPNSLCLRSRPFMVRGYHWQGASVIYPMVSTPAMPTTSLSLLFLWTIMF